LKTRICSWARYVLLCLSTCQLLAHHAQLVEHTKAWRDGWTDILVNATRLADSFHDVYQTIPRTGDSTIPPEPTPVEILQRVARLHAAHNELKDDMLSEVDKVEHMLVQPLQECRGVLKPVKKAIEKREHKKLDFERWNKAVDSAKAKKNKSDKDYSAMSKNEMELERATTVRYVIAACGMGTDLCRHTASQTIMSANMSPRYWRRS
jgi:hypothetical protein